MIAMSAIFENKLDSSMLDFSNFHMYSIIIQNINCNSFFFFSVEPAKKKWKSLCDAYKKSLDRIREASRSGSGGKVVKNASTLSN